MLLEIVAFIGDVGDDFVAVGETHFRDLTDGGIGLLGGAGHDLHADSAAKRVTVQSWRL